MTPVCYIKNESHFIYAGYTFLNAEQKDIAYWKYKKLSDDIRNKLNVVGELKSSGLSTTHKRSLYRVLQNEQSLGVYVDNNRVFGNIMNHKKSRHRYKDYILKRVIKDKINQLIRMSLIDPCKHITLNINIDEQLTATDGCYDLEHTIYEELVNGIVNMNYQTFHQPILFGGAKIKIKFLDSENDYLIQASDVLANRFRASFMYDNIKLRQKKNHCYLHFP